MGFGRVEFASNQDEPRAVSKEARVPCGPTANRSTLPRRSTRRSTAASEFNKAEGGDIWFALDESRPLACFAGIWTNWTSVGKVKEGETTNDLYAFLTTEPNAEVGAIHPKAMPVVLTTPEEVETWMTAPPDEALKLQRPLPDGTLRIVAPGRQGRPGRRLRLRGVMQLCSPSRRIRQPELFQRRDFLSAAPARVKRRIVSRDPQA